jgi:hypothetical protein
MLTEISTLKQTIKNRAFSEAFNVSGLTTYEATKLSLGEIHQGVHFAPICLTFNKYSIIDGSLLWFF